MANKKRKIFLSFAALILAIIDERASEDELANALFFFRCGKANTRTPVAEGKIAELIRVRGSRGTRALGVATRVLEVADESDPPRSYYKGRVKVDMKDLSAFLDANGHDPVGSWGGFTVARATDIISRYIDGLMPVD